MIPTKQPASRKSPKQTISLSCISIPVQSSSNQLSYNSFKWCDKLKRDEWEGYGDYQRVFYVKDNWNQIFSPFISFVFIMSTSLRGYGLISLLFLFVGCWFSLLSLLLACVVNFNYRFRVTLPGKYLEMGGNLICVIL